MRLIAFNSSYMLALVAQLDAGPTGDQQVVGFDPRQIGNILSFDISCELSA